MFGVWTHSLNLTVVLVGVPPSSQSTLGVRDRRRMHAYNTGANFILLVAQTNWCLPILHASISVPSLFLSPLRFIYWFRHTLNPTSLFTFLSYLIHPPSVYLQYFTSHHVRSHTRCCCYMGSFPLFIDNDFKSLTFTSNTIVSLVSASVNKKLWKRKCGMRSGFQRGKRSCVFVICVANYFGDKEKKYFHMLSAV